MIETNGQNISCPAILLCIDSYAEDSLQGKLFHPAQEQPYLFQNHMQFILAVQELLRSAGQSMEVEGQPRPGGSSQRRGQLATFSLKIRFQQHDSWQGTLTWLERRQTVPFRSVLELFLFLHSILSPSKSQA